MRIVSTIVAFGVIIKGRLETQSEHQSLPVKILWTLTKYRSETNQITNLTTIEVQPILQIQISQVN